MRIYSIISAVLLAATAISCTSRSGNISKAPKPLYTDPVNGGSADPYIIPNRDSTLWYMFYTSRRANMENPEGVEWAHGTPIGIATSKNLTDWTFLCNAEIDYKPDDNPSYWAPTLVDDGHLYHMFVTYVPGTFTDWNHPRSIIHLTSSDLKNWKHVSVLHLMSDRVIDPEVMRLPDGTWRLWYNQEPGGKLIAYADSKDLYSWEDHGLVEGIGNCEGPSAFQWKGYYWLLCDEWKGLAVYRSSDALHWIRQPGNILQAPGKGAFDQDGGRHCDVVLLNGHAYIFYFTHVTEDNLKDGMDSALTIRDTFIQVAELFCEDGETITCDRDQDVFINSR
jgi:hypothetical protein